MSGVEIRGYTYGTEAVPKSPVTPEELAQLEKVVGLTDEDRRYLLWAGDVLEDQAEAAVDHWRGIIGQQPYLAFYSLGPDGKPDEAYKVAVKRRFVRWVLDTCRRPHDQVWLDYQEEIGLRHTRAKKNHTDKVFSPASRTAFCDLPMSQGRLAGAGGLLTSRAARQTIGAS
jgi:Protoglobin